MRLETVTAAAVSAKARRVWRVNADYMYIYLYTLYIHNILLWRVRAAYLPIYYYRRWRCRAPDRFGKRIAKRQRTVAALLFRARAEMKEVNAG